MKEVYENIDRANLCQMNIFRKFFSEMCGIRLDINSKLVPGEARGSQDKIEISISDMIKLELAFEEAISSPLTQELDLIRTESYEEGYESGLTQGHKEGKIEGFNEGKDKANKEGYKKGSEEGHTLGFSDGLKASRLLQYPSRIEDLSKYDDIRLTINNS